MQVAVAPAPGVAERVAEALAKGQEPVLRGAEPVPGRQLREQSGQVTGDRECQKQGSAAG